MHSVSTHQAAWGLTLALYSDPVFQSLKRVFAIDIETCQECGGRLRVIASIEKPQLIASILGHVRARRAQAGIAARGPLHRGKGTFEVN